MLCSRLLHIKMASPLFPRGNCQLVTCPGGGGGRNRRGSNRRGRREVAVISSPLFSDFSVAAWRLDPIGWLAGRTDGWMTTMGGGEMPNSARGLLSAEPCPCLSHGEDFNRISALSPPLIHMPPPSPQTPCWYLCCQGELSDRQEHCKREKNK